MSKPLTGVKVVEMATFVAALLPPAFWPIWAQK